MPAILKRILMNGLLAASMLALIGYFYAEMAGMWLMAKAPTRPLSEAPVAEAPSVDPMLESIRYRVPATMALWGFLFVAGGEGLLYLWRKRRPAPVKSEPQTNPAQELLNQLLAKAEAEKPVS
jgi:hypothetical protein